MLAIKTSKAALRASPTWLADLVLDDAPDLWSPDARWLVPSAADKARVRAAVEAQDRADLEAAAEWNERLVAARCRDVPVVDDCLSVGSRRSWLDVAGAALCLAPIVGLAVWVTRLLM